MHPASLALTLWIDADAREPDVRAIRALLRPGDSYVDVGANIGQLVIEGALAVGKSGTVFAFEGHPRTACWLRENLDLNGLQRVRVAQLAVGDRCGWVTFSDMAADDINRVTKSGGGIPVPMVTLDAIVGEASISLLKVDVEGWEEVVFRGARALLSRVRFVYFECWDEHLSETGTSFAEIYDLLTSHGLSLAEVRNDTAVHVGRDHTFPQCVNVFAFRDHAEFSLRLGLGT